MPVNNPGEEDAEVVSGPEEEGGRWDRRHGPKVVALGGGHGLFAALSALRRVTDDLTAVVTVADDGGSSGRLRRELGVLPPGDLRMALAALCGDDEWGQTWSRVVQHRFRSEGELHGHAVGNLLIVALWELLGDPVAGLDWVGRLLGAHGRVLPMASVPLDIEAEVELGGEITTVRGQVACALTPGRVLGDLARAGEPARLPGGGARGARGRLGGVRPRVVVHQRAAAPDGARARRGPARHRARGAWSTSTSPRSRARPTASPPRSTWRCSSSTPRTCAWTWCSRTGPWWRTRRCSRRPPAALGGRLVLADVADAGGAPRHDPRRLAPILAEIFHGKR